MKGQSQPQHSCRGMFFFGREEMKWVSRFSIKFLLVTTAEPDHIQKIESQLGADGKINRR